MRRPTPLRLPAPDPPLFTSRDERWHDVTLVATLAVVLILGGVQFVDLLALTVAG